MPTINIYYQEEEQKIKLKKTANELKKFAAKELTCGDIALNPNEISIRLIETTGNGMIGSVEAEVNAFAFEERVKKQDDFCLDLMKFFQEKTGIDNVKTWLILSELGHSWEE